MTRRVSLRDDRRVADGAQLLVRMNDDRDVTNALKLALAGAASYRVVPAFERSGGVTASCFEGCRRGRGPDRRALHSMALVRAGPGR